MHELLPELRITPGWEKSRKRDPPTPRGAGGWWGESARHHPVQSVGVSSALTEQDT